MSGMAPRQHAVQRLCPASQRAAVFRLSRRQSAGPEHQPARRQGLLRRGRRPDAAVGRRRVLSARRLRQQRRARPGRSDRLRSSTRSSATTTTRPTRISRSPKPSRRARSAPSPTARTGRKSAIIITYDETDGFYDHVAPSEAQHLRRRLDPGGRPAHPDARDLALRRRRHDLASVQRARIGHQVHQRAERPRASRPSAGRATQAALSARANLGQDNLGPSDDPANEVGDLTEAFDTARLKGEKPPIPSSAATFTPRRRSRHCRIWPSRTTRRTATRTAPAQRSASCRPTSSPSPTIKNGKPIDPYPDDVNPRPTQSPGTPTSGTWTP